MNKVLVTGGGHLLDYQVIKRLNERGIRPRSLVLPPSRREAEQLALSRSRPGFEVVVVAPALTIGPEDFGPAPGGSLIKRVIAGRFVPTVDMGVGCVDVRDFADGVLLAAERGRPGQRYVLCAHNPTLKDLVAEIAAVAGIRARSWHLPRWLPQVLISALVFWSRIRRKAPLVPPPIAKLIGRYGWYDARRMREDLGWRLLRFIHQHDASWTAAHLALHRTVEIVIASGLRDFGGLRPAEMR